MLLLPLYVSQGLSQPQSASDQDEYGVWLSFKDASDLYRISLENPLLKREIDLMEQRHILDEREKEFLREKVAFEQERVKLSEEKNKATADALAKMKGIVDDQARVIKEQEKEIKKWKILGYGGVFVGIVIAVCGLLVAM